MLKRWHHMNRACKYPQLQDKEWLYQKYSVEKLSSNQIAEIVGNGCRPGTVICALNRRGIATRSIKETIHREHRGYKSTLLNDPEWLKQKYWIDRLNTYEIAKIAETNQCSVMKALDFHSIPRRDYSKAAKNRKSFWRIFDILENKEWLYQHYIINKKSSTDIAEEVGTSPTNIRRALNKFNIEIRTNSEAQGLVEKDSKYALLNDKDWLFNEYVDKKHSTLRIAKDLGAKSCNSARQFLMKNNIELRTIREGLLVSEDVYYIRKDEGFILNSPVIDGGLLGDASLGISNRESDHCAPYFYRKNKYLQHVLWAGSQIFNGDPFEKLYLDFTTIDGVMRCYYKIQTNTHESLTPFYKRWYPKSNPYKSKKPYEKIIPEDVDISPLSLLHCFLDDGCTYRRKREYERSVKKQIYIWLCLECFPRDNLEMFCEKFKKEYGSSINIKTSKIYGKNIGYGYRVYVSQGSYNRFMEILGPCPPELVPVLGYKWK